MAITLLPDFAEVAERLRRQTVQVRSPRRGGGSGVIWRDDGLIVTNAHVVGRRNATVVLADGTELGATLQAVDERRDLAALSVSAGTLPAAEPADSRAARVGQLVLAVGHPLGLAGAVSSGIIHAVSTDEDWIRADVRLAPGNSGGPLADASGRVLGINSMVAGGLGLAIPSNVVNRFLGGRRPRRIGITVQPTPMPAGGVGLLVSDLEPGSLAERAGLLPGDILTGSGGAGLERLDDFAAMLDREGQIALDVVRGGRLTTIVLPEAVGKAA